MVNRGLQTPPSLEPHIITDDEHERWMQMIERFRNIGRLSFKEDPTQSWRISGRRTWGTYRAYRYEPCAMTEIGSLQFEERCQQMVQITVLGGGEFFHYSGRVYSEVRPSFYFFGNRGREGSWATYFGAGRHVSVGIWTCRCWYMETSSQVCLILLITCFKQRVQGTKV